MREIKFRAWLEGTHNGLKFNSSSMSYDVTIQDGHYADVESGWDIHGRYPTIPIMQYTGLKDKNGVEIYEGDIVDTFHKKYPKQYPDNFYPNGTAARQVQWIVGPHHNGWNIYNGNNSQYEVIGNIHENPDLLEQE